MAALDPRADRVVGKKCLKFCENYLDMIYRKTHLHLDTVDLVLSSSHLALAVRQLVATVAAHQLPELLETKST